MLLLHFRNYTFWQIDALDFDRLCPNIVLHFFNQVANIYYSMKQWSGIRHAVC